MGRWTGSRSARTRGLHGGYGLEKRAVDLGHRLPLFELHGDLHACLLQHGLHVFSIGLQQRDHVMAAIDEADLVITLGYDLVEYSPSFWNANMDKAIVHIDFWPAEIDSHYTLAVDVVGDIADVDSGTSLAFNGSYFYSPNESKSR